MKNDDLRKAFDLRLKGRTYVQIAEELGLNKDTIFNNLNAVLAHGQRMSRCVYPVVSEYIAEHHGGGVRPFARAIGVNPDYMHHILSGTRPMTEQMAGRIAAATGLPPEEVQRRKA